MRQPNSYFHADDAAGVAGRSVSPVADLEHHGVRSVQAQGEADLRRRRIVSTNAVAMVKTDTVPTANGPVMMPVSTHASGCMSANTTPNILRTSATTAALPVQR